MLYVVKITTPANTSKDKPKETIVTVYEQYIVKVDVYFPPGPSLLTGVSIWYGDTQIFPFKEGEWVIGDNALISSPLELRLPEKPCKLRILTYNIDDTYEHTVVVYIHTSDYLLKDILDALRTAVEQSGLTQRSIFGFRRWRWW